MARHLLTGASAQASGPAHPLLLAAALLLGFVGLLFAGSVVLPGRTRQGPVLADGSRRSYKLNGLALYLLTAAVVAAAHRFRWFPPGIVVELFWELFAVANVFALLVTLALYVKGRRGGFVPSPGALGFLKDCFLGTEANPTWLGVDLKMFSYRPSLIGLAVVNWSFAATQYEALGHLTTRMSLYQAFVFVYLTNYFQFEDGMLYTWDVVQERFGWMLVWGDYVLVPFFYSICGWFLLRREEPLTAAAAAALVALFAVGFAMFLGANRQKHAFRSNPDVRIWGRPARTIGGKLLVSGFWGIGRKLNYTGELMVYSAWTMTTGFRSPVPYLLPLWLAVLFVHRARRDERRCRHKYGELWTEYCRHARFRMIPFVY